MTIRYLSDANRLIIQSDGQEKIKHFDAKVRHVFGFKDKCIVQLAMGLTFGDRNILCIDSRGNIVWQVPELDDAPKNNSRIITDVVLKDDGRLLCGSLNGYTYVLNPENGGRDKEGV
jgi:outer membrane protein assembly factor BamB